MAVAAGGGGGGGGGWRWRRLMAETGGGYDPGTERQLERARKQASDGTATTQAREDTEKQLEWAQEQAAEVTATSQVELELQKKRIEQLEMEAAQMRTSSKTDVEEGTVTPTRPRPVKKLLADGSSSAGAGSRLLGIVPMRMWLIIGYLSLLHVMVMMSFTRSNVSLDCDMRLASHPNVTVPGEVLADGPICVPYCSVPGEVLADYSPPSVYCTVVSTAKCARITPPPSGTARSVPGEVLADGPICVLHCSVPGEVLADYSPPSVY
eukprot:gene2591-30984_t